MTDHLIKSFEQELARLKEMVLALGALTGTQLKVAIESAERCDRGLAASVIAREPEADRKTHEIDNLVIRVLALRQPVAIDLRAVLAALRMANELERICDHVEDLARRLVTLFDAAIKPVPSLLNIARYAMAMVMDAMQAYGQLDAAGAQEVCDRDTQLDQMYTALFRELLSDMIDNRGRISANTQMLFMARTIERIGDRATNIAEIVRYLIRGVPVVEQRVKANETKSMMLSDPAEESPGLPETMLHELEILEIHRIADLAAAAREARDRVLTPVREAQLGELPSARGEHHLVGTLGFGALPGEELTHRALREAIEKLLPDIRRKLWVVMRIGYGNYGPADWDRANAAAEAISDATIVAELADEVDLHDRLMKGLYEIGATLPPRRDSAN